MRVVLMIVTILAVLLLVFVLIKYLAEIDKVLKKIGGDGNSYLAKLRLGLRAIETETGALTPNVLKLNETLNNTAKGLKAVDDGLVTGIEKALEQEKYN